MRKTLYTPADFRFLKRQQAHAKPEEERKKSMSLRHLHALKRVSVSAREWHDTFKKYLSHTNTVT